MSHEVKIAVCNLEPVFLTGYKEAAFLSGGFVALQREQLCNPLQYN